MHSNIAIALFTKLKTTYEGQNKFLAFPPGAVSMHSSDFSFLDADTKSGPELNESLAKAANFAKSFNFIANTSTKLTCDDRNLWDIYEFILHQKELASGKRTPQDEKNIKKIRNYLNKPVIKRPDGTKISRQENYEIYQSIYNSLLSDYKIKKLTAEHSSDQNVKDLWSIEEPDLKVKVENALNNWLLKGAKLEVKAKLDELVHLSTKGPFTAWNEYQDDFDKQKFTKTELQGLTEGDFYCTSFYPADFYFPNSSAWQNFTLNKNEIESLCTQAPEELKLLVSDFPLKSLSAEISYVRIKRPWFHSEIFNDKTWKLPDGEMPLSDGGNPATGRIPAIPVAILFARNIKFDIEAIPEPIKELIKVPGINKIINSGIFSNFSKIKVNNATNLSIKPIITASKIEFVKPQPLETRAPLVNILPKVEKDMRTSAITTSNIKRFEFQKPSDEKSNNIVLDKNTLATRLMFLRDSTVNKEIQKHNEPLPEQLREEVEILAFVCEKLPVCPNPDPSLTWN